MTQYESVRTPQDYVNYTFNISSKGVTQVAGELAGLSSTTSTILGDIAFKTSEFLSHTETMAIGAGAAISAVFARATKDAIRFEQQVANVKAIGGESVDAALIGDKAMEYSNKFGMAVSEMTEGLEALARAGITTTSVMTQVLEEGVKLSKLEGIDLEDSINHLISTTNLLSQDKIDMNAPEYGQMLKEMNQHIVSTSESAPINAENIMQTLQHVGGYASASGIDQDDLFAVIAQLGARGTKGEMAGTALRAFIAAGNKDTAQRALARVGLDVTDLWDETGETMLSISEMKNVLDSALDARGYSKQEKLEFYADFVGYKQANQIMKIDTTEVEKYKDSISNAWDLGTKLNTILGTVKGNLDRIWQISQNFMTKVGGKLLPIFNAILAPIRIGLELFTKIPFMDSLGAGLALFAGLRTVLLVINNIVPAIGGLFSSMRGQKQYSKGIRGEWEKTRDAIKDANEVLSNWNNKDKLAQIHRKRRGPSAEDKAHMEDTIFRAMYYESSYHQELQIPWEELEPGLQHAIGRQFLGTPEFEANWERMRTENENIAEKISQEAKVLDFGEYSPDDELVTINRYVQYIYSIMKEANGPLSNRKRNQQQSTDSKTKQESSRQPYTEEAQKVEVIIDGRKTSKSAFQFEDINKIKSTINVSEYGDYEHIYRDNVQQFVKDYNQAINDLIRKVNSFSNTKKEYMDKTQIRRYEKSLRREAMSEEGIRFASRANDSDIRYYLRTGVYREPKDKMLGIRDDQIKAMGAKVGLDFSDIDNITGPDKREEQLAEIRKALKEKNISIDDVAEEANKVWVESQKEKRSVTRVPTELLRKNKDMTLELAAVFTQPTSDIDQAVKQVQAFFENETDESVIASAARSMMGHLKLHGEIFSDIEQEEIKYILENIVRLENTAAKLNIGLEDGMRVFSDTANYNHINKQLANFWNNSGIVDDLVDNMIDVVVGQFTIVQELVAESYIDWIKSSTPGGTNNIDINAIESRLRNKLFYTQQGQISTSDINDAILLKELYNEPDMYNILLRRKFTESNQVIHTWGDAPDLRYTELTNPSTGEKYRYNKEYGILNKQKMKQIFQTRHVDRSSFIIDEDLNEIYDDAVRQWKQKAVYSLSDISGENGYLHPLLGPLHESFDNYSVDELLHIGMYRKNGIGFSLTSPREVQEAILTGLISERQVKTWIKKGLLMPSDYIDDTLSWKASGYDGRYFNKEKHYEQTRKKINEEHAANQLERERLDKISDITNEAFDYAREKGQKSIALKSLVQQISSTLDKEKDLKYDNDDIYNAIKEYADYRSNAVDIKDNKAILNKTKGIKRVRSAKDILYRDWFDENLEISWAAHQMLGIPLDAKPTDVLKDILAGNIENVDENTKLFRTKFNAGTGSRKYSADSAYNINKKFFESDYAAARFFGLPLLIEEYQDELPIIKDLLEEGKRFEAYIELMRNADNINYDDLDYEISHDSKLTNSEIESLQHELIDVRQQAKEVADGIEFELEHLGTVEYFTNVKTPEQLEEQRFHKEKMLKDEYAKHGKTVLSGLDIQAMVKSINERGGRGDRLDIFIDEIGEHWGNATDIIDFVDKIDESAYELIWAISTERFDNIMEYINTGDISKLDEHTAHMLHLDKNMPINWWKDWDEYKDKMVTLSPNEIAALEYTDILSPEFIEEQFLGKGWKEYITEFGKSQGWNIDWNDISDIMFGIPQLADTEVGDKKIVKIPLPTFLNYVYSGHFTGAETNPGEIMNSPDSFDKPNYIKNLLEENQEVFNKRYDRDDIQNVNISNLIGDRPLDSVVKKQSEKVKKTVADFSHFMDKEEAMELYELLQQFYPMINAELFKNLFTPLEGDDWKQIEGNLDTKARRYNFNAGSYTDNDDPFNLKNMLENTKEYFLEDLVDEVIENDFLHLDRMTGSFIQSLLNAGIITEEDLSNDNLSYKFQKYFALSGSIKDSINKTQSLPVWDLSSLEGKIKQTIHRKWAKEHEMDLLGEPRLPDLEDLNFELEYPYWGNEKSEKDYFRKRDLLNKTNIGGLGYGSLDENMGDFINNLYMSKDIVRNAKQEYPTLHRNASASILSILRGQSQSVFKYEDDKYEKLGTVTDRIEEYGVYIAKLNDRGEEIRQIINLRNKEATEYAFKLGYVTENQLKKWLKLSDDLAYTVSDIDQWKIDNALSSFKTSDLFHTVYGAEINTRNRMKQKVESDVRPLQTPDFSQVEIISNNTKSIAEDIKTTTRDSRKNQEEIVENTSKTVEEISNIASDKNNDGIPQTLDEMEEQRLSTLHGVHKDSNQSSLDDFIAPQNNQSKFEKENHYNLRQLYNSIVFTRGQRGIIQKLIAKGDNEGITKEIKKSNANVGDDEAETIAKNLIKNPSTLDTITATATTNRDRTDRQVIDNEPTIIDIEEDTYWEDKKQRSDAFWAEQERLEQEGVYEHAAQMAANMFNQFEEEYSKTQAAKAFGDMFNNFDEDYEQNKDKYQNRVKRNARAQKLVYNVEQVLESISTTIKNKMKTTDKWIDKNFLPEYAGKYDVWGKMADSIETAIEPLEVFNNSLQKLTRTFPALIPVTYGLNKVLEAARFTISALRKAEILLMTIRIASGKATDDLSKKEGYQTAKKWAKKIKKYIPEDSILFEAMERLGDYGTRAAGFIEKIGAQLIGIIIKNIAILGPIAAAIAVAVGALWLSEQNHAKALKKATEENEKAKKEAAASYITYKNLHDARKNENDAMKRQQLARKESIALYQLEIDRIKRLKAIKTESDLRNDKTWGEYGARADFQKMGWLESIFAAGIPFLGTLAKWMAGDFESQYEQYEGSTGEIRRIKEDSVGNMFATGNQNAVSAWYDAHARQLAQIEAFAPELQELYDLESRLIDKYGSKEAARNSKEFKEAVQEFSDATGLNRETAEKYLDYLQTEANVENARYAMQAEVDMIVSNAQAEAYKALYGDEAGIGELDSVQDAMVYATADQIFKDAYQELWWSMLMEWLQSIYYAITLNWNEASKHAKAAGAYQEGMRELAENQQRITQEGVDIAKEDQRKEYEEQQYSYYGDTPFGGAVASSAAAEQDYAAEAMNKEDMYYNASKSNGEAAAQGFKEGLDQHSPGKIARSMEAEMNFSKEAVEQGGKSVMSAVYSVSDATTSAFDWMSSNTSSAFSDIYNATSDVFNVISDGAEWVGGTIFSALSGGANSVFKGFSDSINKSSNVTIDNSTTEVHIHTVNINTDDDPEKIKDALIELIVEFGDLVTPKQVSRVVGTPPATSTASETTDPTAEDPNAQNADGNNTDGNNNNSSSNNNPTT